MATRELDEAVLRDTRFSAGRRRGRRRLLLLGAAAVVAVGTPVAAAAGLAGSEQPANLHPATTGPPTQVQGPTEKASIDGADAPGDRADAGGVDGADAPGGRDD